MKVFTQSINFVADKKLLEFIENKMSKLERFHDKIVDAEVFLKVQKTKGKENKITDVKLNIPGQELVVKKTTKTFEEGISIVVDSLKRQLEKSKQKQKETLAS